jgi:hypothetical protein
MRRPPRRLRRAFSSSTSPLGEAPRALEELAGTEQHAERRSGDAVAARAERHREFPAAGDPGTWRLDHRGVVFAADVRRAPLTLLARRR